MMYFGTIHILNMILFLKNFYCSTNSDVFQEIILVKEEEKDRECIIDLKNQVCKEKDIMPVDAASFLEKSEKVLQLTDKSLPKKIDVDPVKLSVESCEKALILEGKNGEPSIVEKVNADQVQKKELIDTFNGLKNKLSEVTKFYDYFDVLTLIDKSIALIQEFENTPVINVNRNSMICKKMIKLITAEFQNLDKLWSDVHARYFKERTDKKKEHKFKYMINGLTGIKKCKNDLKDQFDRYKSEHKLFMIDVSQNYNEFKLVQLKKLHEDFKKIREKFYPLNEELVNKHALLFEDNFKKKVSGIYTNLVECHEKEKRSLKVLFDIYKGILKGIEEAKSKLNTFSDDLGGPKKKQNKRFLIFTFFFVRQAYNFNLSLLTLDLRGLI